ncbi:MAG: pyrroline-5-carboxylate reductase [Bradyrhizobiaceae bacterium]|nr:pyrroline-5-carboxylate reductase [Bradyrhizobiaceae bacterium]
MGGALMESWLARGLPPALLSVLDPSPPPEVAKLIATKRIARDPQPPLLPMHAAVVLAVKPQMAPDVMPQIARFVGRDTVVVSIMAGRTLGFLGKHLPKGTAIVRAMPNMPAAIGRGITVAVPNARVKSAARELADALLSATGPVEWIKNEKWMDAVTAVSGSGPAYVFLLAESLARAGAAAGLPKALAARLARETVAGAGELLHRSTLDAAKLRENVTSPGGTTAAALKVLMSRSGLDPLMKKAVAAATRRSRQLAG